MRLVDRDERDRRRTEQPLGARLHEPLGRYIKDIEQPAPEPLDDLALGLRAERRIQERRVDAELA